MRPENVGGEVGEYAVVTQNAPGKGQHSHVHHQLQEKLVLDRQVPRALRLVFREIRQLDEIPGHYRYRHRPRGAVVLCPVVANLAQLLFAD